ncbi:MAG: PEGA domain-containing protein [bacterium]
MRRIIVTLSICIFLARYLPAEGVDPEIVAPAILFVNSDPIGADVYLDGRSMGKTPLKVDNLLPGKYEIRIVKERYAEVRETVAIADRQRINFFKVLVPWLDITFVDPRVEVRLGKDVVGIAPIMLEDLPTGKYELKSSSHGVSIAPADGKSWGKWVLLGCSVSMFVGAAAFFFLGQDAYKGYRNSRNPKEVAELQARTVMYDTLTYASLGGATISGGISAYFFLMDDSQIAGDIDRVELVSPRDTTSYPDEELFDSGMQALSDGKWLSAIDTFTSIIEKHPDSRYVPLAQYEIGYAYRQMRDNEKAAESWEEFLRSYPIYELYDLANKELGDTYYSIGKFKDALTAYERVDPQRIAAGDVPPMYYNMGVAYEELENWERMLWAYQKYLSSPDGDGKVIPSRFKVGVAYFRLGRNREAKESFEGFIRDFPQEVELIAKAKEYLRELESLRESEGL